MPEPASLTPLQLQLLSPDPGEEPHRRCKDCGADVGPRQHRCPGCREEVEKARRAKERSRKRRVREVAQTERRCPGCGGPIEKFRKRCDDCVRASKRERDLRYWEENKERLREQQRVWARENYDPDKQREKNQRYRSKPGVKERLSRNARAANIRKRYGVTLEEYAEMTSGVCAICGNDGKLVLDHCHTTKLARGGLCSSHNTGLGYFGDDPELLRKAATYIEQSRAFRVKPMVLELKQGLLDYLAANRGG